MPALSMSMSTPPSGRGYLLSLASSLLLPVSSSASCESSSSSSPSSSSSKYAPSSFDPEALERGAKALREIANSPHAKKVLDVTQQQEKTREQEEKTKQAEYSAAQAQFNVEREKVQWEEQRKTMQQQNQQKAQLAQYEDELARKRMAAEHEAARERNAETVAMQEESTRKQEALRQQTELAIQAERRMTDERKAELDKDVARAKALAEAEGRANEAKLAEDVNRRLLGDRLEAQRKQALEAINATFQHLGKAAMTLLTDRQKLVSFAAGTTALALGVFGARESARVTGRVVERMLGTPPLVRETSRRRMLGLLPGTGLRDAGASGGAAAAASADAKSSVLRNVVLAPTMESRLNTLANFTASARRHGVPYRHMLFYGPPGTGKTLAARQMARYSGLEYAVLSGGDVAPLGNDAVTQLHSVFDWSESSSKGVLLFVDEADAFLRRRDTANVSEGVRAALNVMLSRTGGASKDFVLVLATNRPEDLDEALLDRVDEVLEFDLPGTAEREEMLRLFMKRYLTDPPSSSVGISGYFKGIKAQSDPVELDGISDGDIAEAAVDLNGLSGREVEKVVIAMQAAAYGSGDAKLTLDAFRNVVKTKIQEKSSKLAFVDIGDAAGAALSS